ncbi:MAG: YhbY family RNA-binding protein [Clostridiales bacterium]|nr:YhbY family RNA-binding protein [Clostridiales bacterium]
MLTSKARAELRARTHDLDLIVTVGKSGITDNLIRETDLALQARELIKCQVLESALLSAREASDALCAATGADGVQVIGNKFVLYRKSEKRQAAPKKKTENPVRRGVQQRRKKARELRQKRDAYFKQAAIEAAIERQKEKQRRKQA